jgi:prophage antirepressor-like protein
MTRQPTEKEQVMSFEEMAESAKSAGLPTEFKFDESCVRTVIKDGEPWFVAKDVCEILDLEDPSMTVSRLEEDQRGKANVCTPGGQQQMLTVSESGLYSLIFTSRKPEAKRFRKWIASEVLPSIRKTGGYQIPEGGFIGLKGDEVDYERWLLERALLDAQIIAIEMQRIGVHFLQQMTDDPEMGAARANQNLDVFHDAVRDNMQRSITFLDRARPGTRWTRTKK